MLAAGASFAPIAAASPNTDFTERKATVLRELAALAESDRSLAGTQVNEYEIFLECDSMDRLTNLTGEEQAVIGLELMFAGAYAGYEDRLVEHAVTHSKKGGAVTLAWHMRNPLKVCTRGEFFDCSKTPMSAAELARMLTPDTSENRLWKKDIAIAARTLKRLREAGVIILFRPLHEMNGGWFWWGKKAQFPELWDSLYTELMVRHGLDNLIWVWSGDRAIEGADRYWPKQNLPDIAGTDVYENDPGSEKYLAAIANVRPLSGRRTFALTEVGRLPNSAIMSQIRPAWVLLWGGAYINADWVNDQPCPQCNTAEQTAAFFAQPRIVSLAESPDKLRKALAGGKQSRPSPRPHCPAKLIENDEIQHERK